MIKYLYNEHTVNRVMSNFTVVSFYTPDWKYPEYAQSLANDCKRLGLDFAIESKPSTNTYVGNCNLKPYFIRDKLQELKKPILWMDVDGSVLNVPEELKILPVVDIAGYVNKQFLDRIYVNTILFNYTSNTLAFLDTWCEYVKNYIDDGAFNDALKNYSSKIQLCILPSEQIIVATSHNLSISSEICFVNRLSASDLKWQYKNKVESGK